MKPLPSILIVEDEKLLAKAMTRFLQLHGYRTETLADGAMAEQQMRSEHFDVLITDLGLATVGGETLIKLGLAQSHLQRVIVISGNHAPAKPPVKENPKIAYLQKPFDLNELLRQIQECTSTGKPPSKRGRP